MFRTYEHRGEVFRECDGNCDVLNDALLEIVDAGIIDREGYEAFYLPVYYRTLDELTAPRDRVGELALGPELRPRILERSRAQLRGNLPVMQDWINSHQTSH